MPEATIPYVVEGTEVKGPTRGSDGAAAWDFYAAKEVLLKPYEPIIIPSGIKAAIPDEHCLLLLPRSGLVFKTMVVMPNSVGLIDEDYRGVIGLSAMWVPDPLSVIEVFENFGHPPVGYAHDVGHARTHIALRYRKDAVLEIPRHARLAQGLLLRYVEQVWEMANALSATVRGHGGFGSTGA